MGREEVKRQAAEETGNPEVRAAPAEVEGRPHLPHAGKRPGNLEEPLCYSW